MTPAYWLFAGLIVFCLLCLFAFFIAKAINTEWDTADQPIYRTADGGVLSADARAALRAANADLQVQDAAITNWQLPTDNLTTIRREATAAALRDLGSKPGTITPNPHEPGTLAYHAWRDSYLKVANAPAARHSAS